MINIRTIRKLKNNDGLTLKNGKAITYKTGWQVADHGVEATTAEEAIKAVRAMNGNCGVWFENGIYYIDHSFRVKTKHEAIAIGRQHNQISVLCWRTMGLAYC
jgi:predicted ATP-grasp superfamily ATP-dependent carboligase